MTALRRIRDPDPRGIPVDPADFLRELGGPAAIELTGRDRGRRRAAATLVHGNEPSGLRALHGWLREGARPGVDLLLVLASVETALHPPLFSHRQLPGRRDLNRCFRPPFEGREGALAGDLLRALEAFGPEALVDLHNNTGHNPPYAVGPRCDAFHRGLAGLFGEFFVHSDLALGALVEATDPLFPSVTIECGRAGDPAADRVARQGLEAFASGAPAPGAVATAVHVLVEPRRVRVRDGASLAFAPAPDPGVDLTLRSDLDNHNFRELAPGHALGWVRAGAAWPLEMRDLHGRDLSPEHFALVDGELRIARPLVPIMMTTHPEIARSDCLFYAVRADTAVRASARPETAGP